MNETQTFLDTLNEVDLLLKYLAMDKEIRWIKGKLYREECPGNWEPYDPDAPPDTERVQNIKTRRAELQTMLDHIRRTTNELQNNRE